MKKRRNYGLLPNIGLFLSFASITWADNLNPKTELLANKQLMSARDVVGRSFSNITIQNKTGAPITVYGLYINQLGYNQAANCVSATALYPINVNPDISNPSNLAGGAFVTPISFMTNQKLPIGQNYLYNMLYTAIYYNNQLPNCTHDTTSAPPDVCSPCTLPGCTWFTDINIYPAENWCIYLGVLSPAKNNTASASNVPPYGYAVRGAGYNYDLVTQYNYIGPITCDDRTLTCSVATTQNVPFPH